MLDLTGMTFGKLTALEPQMKRASNGKVIWTCKCSCGAYSSVRSSDLRSGKTTSCGCYKKASSRHRWMESDKKKARKKGRVSCFGGGKVRKSANTQSGNTNRAKAGLKRIEAMMKKGAAHDELAR